MRKKYYDINPILQTNSVYHVILGERSNGKSYAVKKCVIDDFLKKGLQFFYLRRYGEDVKSASVQRYFADFNAYIKKCTNGDFDEVYCYSQYIYLRNSETGEKVLAGYYSDLGSYERLKSQQFPDVYNFIFEEFITDKRYINGDGEPDLLMNILSTVLRNRKGRIFLIGNTVSQICPYFIEWGIDVKHMKQGTIQLIDYEGVQIAVEYCESVGNTNNFIIGGKKTAIMEGKWEVTAYPKLLKPMSEYDVVWRIGFDMLGFKYVLELLVVKEFDSLLVYVYPFDRLENPDTIDRWISDKFSEDPQVTQGFRRESVLDMRIAALINRKKICFSDNQTGTNFYQILRFLKVSVY